MRQMIEESGIASEIYWAGLDVGGRLINTSVRDLFPNTIWTGLDIKPGPGVDVVADASTWKPDRLYDLVISTELLEHTPVWAGCVATMVRALAPGGYLFITCASIGREAHGAEGTMQVPPGEYYANVPPGSLTEVLMEHLEEAEVRYVYPPGDVYAWARKWS
jgi:hypothetical protein